MYLDLKKQLLWQDFAFFSLSFFKLFSPTKNLITWPFETHRNYVLEMFIIFLTLNCLCVSVHWYMWTHNILILFFGLIRGVEPLKGIRAFISWWLNPWCFCEFHDVFGICKRQSLLSVKILSIHSSVALFLVKEENCCSETPPCV